MKLVFVNIMQELHRFDSTSYITQPPVPLAVLEREIDQLAELYPAAFLQFTDDNLLADREYATALLGLIRQKRRRFVTMVTVDQLCDTTLLVEMASAGWKKRWRPSGAAASRSRTRPHPFGSGFGFST